MLVKELTRDAVLSIALQMRVPDRAEIFATRFDTDAAALVDDLLAGDPVGAVITADDGVAVAVIAGTEMWPGLWSLWMLATDRWPEVARGATRFAKNELWPTLKILGLRRGECRSAAAHTMAHRWIRYLGGRLESVHPAYGKDGETFIGFVIHGETKNVRDSETLSTKEV